MKKIRILDVEFENDISAWEVPALRGAIVATVGREHFLFHNHIDKVFRYSYPLIQYKRIGKKPHLVCVEMGVDDIHNFFENKQEGIILGNRPYELKVDKLSLNNFTLQVWDSNFNYFLQDWLPLNQKNYKDFKTLKSEIDQLEFLEKILKGNVLSFAKGIDWYIDKEIKLRIQNIVRVSPISYKGIKLEAFTINFSSNISLPNNIGLGKNASLGFGVLRNIIDKK